MVDSTFGLPEILQEIEDKFICKAHLKRGEIKETGGSKDGQVVLVPHPKPMIEEFLHSTIEWLQLTLIHTFLLAQSLAYTGKVYILPLGAFGQSAQLRDKLRKLLHFEDHSHSQFRVIEQSGKSYDGIGGSQSCEELLQDDHQMLVDHFLHETYRTSHDGEDLLELFVLDMLL